MRKIKLANNIYWVGAVDWITRDFHGYSINGTTYNAFLIIDDKVTLIDTVKGPYTGELLHRIRNIIDPKKIDYLVVNHVEMDHSGALPEIMEAINPEKVICSKMGHKALLQHFHRPDWPYHVVTSGEEIRLGQRTLSFLETRMLHWPDSMFTYLKEDQILFSSDAFGAHFASSERFDDEVSQDILMREATKYYANILTLYSPFVQKLLAQVQEMQLPIKMLAPDHGVVWRSNPAAIIEAYSRWCTHQGNGKALVIYDTMWDSTKMMARAVAEGLHEQGVEYKLFDLQVNHRSDVMTDVLEASALVLGSSTLNNGMLPRMVDFLMYMRGLRPAKKVAATFGSYGWSGEAVGMMNAIIKELDIVLCHKGLKVPYVPEHGQLGQCVELGRTVGRAMQAMMAGEKVESVL
ncbi:FprA family A-type flavoprotein [Desulfobulbus oligotrophicus]|jgi:flavorubredoxin|uniref:Flavodoxin domain-containing protein n=1 Tax=Desulfobulbus oligotrophicus TaxID=1909699 RepID=A0A7T6APW9_9BACT|nr:flavodoxin domain-containing protein [Desulfobulbus oligotrophicus]MDY0390282.1 flavodoxin domain-containing protein [Desulfobulbus oligotrophicus]QQG65106.1 flavodoxin domain-containing protein [Desulfobulbus oligotrophicus]